MANVRLDANGLPKGFVYEPTAPTVHRSNVTAVDAGNPVGAAGAVDCTGYEQCRFDITITGTGFQSLEVQCLFWNSRQSAWCSGGSRSFTATGTYALVVDARGAIIYLKVTAFSGTSFTFNADYLLS